MKENCIKYLEAKSVAWAKNMSFVDYEICTVGFEENDAVKIYYMNDDELETINVPIWYLKQYGGC